nr:uncharacterized protein LOC111429002 isoform X2 [Onthophagus taurus]
MPAIASCVDKQCPTNSLPPRDRQLFCFPRSEDLRRQWLERMSRPDLMELSHAQLHGRRLRVCERHFNGNQFQTSDRKKLTAHQIPRRANLEDNPDSPANTPSGTSIPCMSSKFETPKLRRCKGRTSQVTPKERKLLARLKNAETILRYRKKRIQYLSQSQKVYPNPFSPSSLTNIQQIHTLPKPLRVFILSLLRNFHVSKKNRRYTLEEKALFLSIFKHGPRSYRYLQKILSLPSTRTLRRSLATFQLTSGINLNLFTYLKSVSSKMALRDRFCTLMFDEMDTGKNLNLKLVYELHGFMMVNHCASKMGPLR